LGMILLDAGDDQTVLKMPVIGRGVRSHFTEWDDLATKRTLELILFQGVAPFSAEEIAQVLIPNAHIKSPTFTNKLFRWFVVDAVESLQGFRCAHLFVEQLTKPCFSK
jgi:hypothetical protein